MSDEMLGPCYTDSSIAIKRGDRVNVDGEKGQIGEVCLPHTELARDYSCEETGGLLVQFDDGILALLPFGFWHWAVRSDQNE
ncbi:MAG TPA: hypothetical protein VMF06_09185 [Candidatus Limnocylindria bacterium]|jgi:hypothetical protein|nr:hypothetical protein [Candidatus Limnocylindria bacterium]